MTLLAIGAANGRRSWTVEAPDGRQFAVFAVAGEHYVSDALCPHNSGPLVEGWVREKDRMLICPWHWFRFDLTTGRCGVHPRYNLQVYPVVEQDGELYADVGEAAATRSWSDILRSHARQR